MRIGASYTYLASILLFCPFILFEDGIHQLKNVNKSDDLEYDSLLSGQQLIKVGQNVNVFCQWVKSSVFLVDGRCSQWPSALPDYHQGIAHHYVLPYSFPSLFMILIELQFYHDVDSHWDIEFTYTNTTVQKTAGSRPISPVEVTFPVFLPF